MKFYSNGSKRTVSNEGPKVHVKQLVLRFLLFAYVTLKVVLTFESLYKILKCDHSLDNFSVICACVDLVSEIKTEGRL